MPLHDDLAVELDNPGSEDCIHGEEAHQEQVGEGVHNGPVGKQLRSSKIVRHNKFPTISRPL